jgi:hypothetical protein
VLRIVDRSLDFATQIIVPGVLCSFGCSLRLGLGSVLVALDVLANVARVVANQRMKFHPGDTTPKQAVAAERCDTPASNAGDFPFVEELLKCK